MRARSSTSSASASTRSRRSCVKRETIEKEQFEKLLAAPPRRTCSDPTSPSAPEREVVGPPPLAERARPEAPRPLPRPGLAAEMRGDEPPAPAAGLTLTCSGWLHAATRGSVHAPTRSARGGGMTRRSTDPLGERERRRARIMGIVNVTPDSFSDGGRYLDAAAAIEHGLELVAAGGGDHRRRRRVDAAGGGAGRASQEERRARRAGDRGARRGRPAPPRSRSTPPSSRSRAPRSTRARVRQRRDRPARRARAGRARGGARRRVLPHPHAGRARARCRSARTTTTSSREVASFLSRARRVRAGSRHRSRADPRRPGHRLRQDRRAQPRAARAARRARSARPAGADRDLAQVVPWRARRRAASATAWPATIATNVIALLRGASVFRVHDVAAVRDALEVTAATVSGR